MKGPFSSLIQTAEEKIEDNDRKDAAEKNKDKE